MFQSQTMEKFIEEQKNPQLLKNESRELKIKQSMNYFQDYEFIYSEKLPLFLIFIISLILINGLIFVHEVELNFTHSFILPLLISVIFIKTLEYFSKKEFKSNFRKLFINLAEKPYEIRVEEIKKEKSKLKVIIEENILLDNRHVIKEKSKHITGYVNLNASGESVINLILTLVKESEIKFKG